MGFDFTVVAPLLPSHCGFSFVFGCGVSFLVSSSGFLLMSVQQLAVIPVLSQEGVSTRPFTPPSWTNPQLPTSCIVIWGRQKGAQSLSLNNRITTHTPRCLSVEEAWRKSDFLQDQQISACTYKFWHQLQGVHGLQSLGMDLKFRAFCIELYFLFVYFLNLFFIFGCIGSSLLCVGFL